MKKIIVKYDGYTDIVMGDYWSITSSGILEIMKAKSPEESEVIKAYKRWDSVEYD